jgi:cell division protein FtsW
MKGIPITAAIFLLLSGLLAIGALMIYSASSSGAREAYGDSLYYLKRQGFWMGLGILVFLLARRWDYHRYRRWSRWCVVSAVVVLAAVLVPGLGTSAGGAQRWIRAGWIGLQPSELAKYLLIAYLADLLSRRQEEASGLVRGFLPPAAATVLLAGLVLLQPDLGTAVSMIFAGAVMIFVAGIRIGYLVLSALLCLPALYLLVFRVAYRRKRILAFLDPWADAQGSGFQIIQSLIALGSGGIGGVGLGESRQKLFYLPASSTDFIFSIMGEELGFLGASALVFLFLLLLWLGYSTARSAPDLYGQLLATGITAMIVMQAFVNMGVASGLLPTKGLPLPFISYGGSNLISSCLALGVLSNIAFHRSRPPCRHLIDPRRRDPVRWAARRLIYARGRKLIASEK